MSVAAAPLLLQIKSTLNQAGNMTLAAVPDGSGGFTMNNDDVLLFAVNRFFEWVTENCYSLRGKAQMSNLPAGTRTVQLQSLTPDTGQGRMWSARAVNYGGKLLQRVDEGRLDTARPGKEFLANGSVDYWFDAGQPDTIGLDAAPPDNTKTLTVVGQCHALPLALSAGTGVVTEVSFLPDPIIWQIGPVGAAIFAARKNYDNEFIYGRLGDLIPQAEDALTRLYNNIDPDLRRWRFPNPPVLVEVPK